MSSQTERLIIWLGFIKPTK